MILLTIALIVYDKSHKNIKFKLGKVTGICSRFTLFEGQTLLDQLYISFCYNAANISEAVLG